MAISRAQLVKELEPGLNALLGWSTSVTTINTLKYTQLNQVTELRRGSNVIWIR